MGPTWGPSGADRSQMGPMLAPWILLSGQRFQWKLAFSLLNMFNLRICNAATIRYSLLKFGHVHLCGKSYKYFLPHCCKCSSFGCIAAIRCGNACHGPHSNSIYSGSEHRRFNSPRLVKREVGFSNPRHALIGSKQLWHVDDLPYYREYMKYTQKNNQNLIFLYIYLTHWGREKMAAIFQTTFSNAFS